MNLIIVESPTKAKTITKFLGKDFEIQSSYGHIRDLPSSTLGIDVEKNFEPKYIIMPKAKVNIAKLKKLAVKADKIIMATDPDREGEAIAWHLTKALDLDNEKPNKKTKKQPKEQKIERIAFHEITKKAIEEALENPRQIDMNLVDAQQARRVLDRLVGYKLSPFLWKKVTKGLSAGRVQSVAVRLIVDREREIEKFIPEEYWTINALLKKQKNEQLIEALLSKINGETIPKLGIKNKEKAEEVLNDLKGAQYKILDSHKSETTKNPLPPFTTSTLQQEANKKLRFSGKQTMFLAQELYEGIQIGKKEQVGLITYMRTDSVNISEKALFEAKDLITKLFGENYHAGYLRKFKTKSKMAQEAHEAIRPTDPTITPEQLKKYLGPQQLKLYDLIWKRFIASQMAPAKFDSTTIEIQATPKYIFQTSGQIMRFDGFLKIYPMKFEEKKLPILEVGEILDLDKLVPEQHFTKPPARYNEASLIKILELNGIGRPSTYAPIISTIQDRNYVAKDQNRYFRPTEIGKVVNDLLVEHFSEIVDIQFTSHMESNLDSIAQGKTNWVPTIKEFYDPFAKKLEEKYKEVSKSTYSGEETDEVCEKCGSKMIIRLSKYGRFLACSGFPKCKNAKPLTPKPETKDPQTK